MRSEAQAMGRQASWLLLSKGDVMCAPLAEAPAWLRWSFLSGSALATESTAWVWPHTPLPACPGPPLTEG